MSKQPIQPDIFGRDSDDEAGENPGGPYSPPDEPMGSHAYGITRDEERRGESLAERDKHLQPENQPGGDPAVRLSQDGDGAVDDVDDEAEMLASIAGDEDLSAEELAVHITERP